MENWHIICLVFFFLSFFLFTSLALGVDERTRSVFFFYVPSVAGKKQRQKEVERESLVWPSAFKKKNIQPDLYERMKKKGFFIEAACWARSFHPAHVFNFFFFTTWRNNLFRKVHLSLKLLLQNKKSSTGEHEKSSE